MQMSNATSWPGPGTPHSLACKMAIRKTDGMRKKEKWRKKSNQNILYITHVDKKGMLNTCYVSDTPTVLKSDVTHT